MLAHADGTDNGADRASKIADLLPGGDQRNGHFVAHGNGVQDRICTPSSQAASPISNSAVATATLSVGAIRSNRPPDDFQTSEVPWVSVTSGRQVNDAPARAGRLEEASKLVASSAPSRPTIVRLTGERQLGEPAEHVASPGRFRRCCCFADGETPRMFFHVEVASRDGEEGIRHVESHFAARREARSRARKAIPLFPPDSPIAGSRPRTNSRNWPRRRWRKTARLRSRWEWPRGFPGGDVPPGCGR